MSDDHEPLPFRAIPGGKDQNKTGRGWESPELFTRRYGLHLAAYTEGACRQYGLCPFCDFRAERGGPWPERTALVRRDLMDHLHAQHETDLVARVANPITYRMLGKVAPDPDAPVVCNCQWDAGHEPTCDIVLAHEYRVTHEPPGPRG